MTALRWQWDAAGVAWHLHAGPGTVTIWYESRLTPGGMRTAIHRAADAAAFDVAFVIGSDPIARYRLRGPLARLKAKLAPVLARRVEAYGRRPPSPPVPKWNGAGCWCPMHSAEAGGG